LHIRGVGIGIYSSTRQTECLERDLGLTGGKPESTSSESHVFPPALNSTAPTVRKEEKKKTIRGTKRRLARDLLASTHGSQAHIPQPPGSRQRFTLPTRQGGVFVRHSYCTAGREGRGGLLPAPFSSRHDPSSGPIGPFHGSVNVLYTRQVRITPFLFAFFTFPSFLERGI